MRINFREILIVFLLLTIVLPSLQSCSICLAQGDQVKQLISAALSEVRSAEFRFQRRTASGEESVLVGFNVAGEEVIQGEDVWRVRGYIISPTDSGEGTLWISKSTGTTLKAQVDNEVLTGENAQLVAMVFLNLLAFAIKDVEAVENASTSPYGRVTLLGSQVKEYGPTKLLVYMWRYEGYENAPPEYRFRQDVWLAPMSFGYLLVKLWFERFDGSESGGFDLLSLTLARSQPLPRVTVRVETSGARARPGEKITFSIACSNAGEATGVQNLTVRVDGVTKESWLLLLEPGESRNFTFTIAFADEGDHTVEVGGEVFTVSVKQTPPAMLRVTGLRIEPETPRTGEPVTITVIVENTGGETGTLDIALKIDSAILESRKVTLEPGESRALTFRYMPESSGAYKLEVDGLSTTMIVEEKGAPRLEVPPYVLALFAAAVAAVVAVIVAIVRRRTARLPPPPPP